MLSNMYRQRPPPVPFDGQPPPMPSSLLQAIPATTWASGCWQPNPHYNPARMFNNSQQQPQFVPWVPAQQWAMARAQATAHQQQQQQQSYNPYRKQAKPPSAEYLASSLSDNPLGLENMDPSKSLYNNIPPEAIAGLDDGAANKHTPWIWRPKSLEADPEKPDDPASSDDDEDTDEEEARPRAVPPRESFTSPVPLQPTFSPNIVRTPEHYRTGSASIEGRMQSVHLNNTTPSRPHVARHASMPASSMTGVQHLSDEPNTILSPLIINNTPKPSTNTRQLAAAAAVAASSSLSRHATVPAVLSPIPEGPANPRTATLAAPSSSASAYAAASHRRQSHDPHPTRSSPSTPPPHRPRTPPHYTYQRQAHYQTPPNSAPAATAYFQQQQVSTPTPSSRQSSRGGSRERAPPPPSGSSYPTYMTGPPSAAPPHPIPAPFPSASTTTANPYPTPPSGSTGSSPGKIADTSMYYQPQQQQQQYHHHYRSNTAPATSTPPASRRGSATVIIPPGRKRKGYWNRRGDHLTATGYVVYAPPHHAFPPDLGDYPKEHDPTTTTTDSLSSSESSSSSSISSSGARSEKINKKSKKMKDRTGYMDQNGVFAEWMRRPELPESLPRHGKEPVMPYEEFIEYV